MATAIVATTAAATTLAKWDPDPRLLMLWFCLHRVLKCKWKCNHCLISYSASNRNSSISSSSQATATATVAVVTIASEASTGNNNNNFEHVCHARYEIQEASASDTPFLIIFKEMALAVAVAVEVALVIHRQHPIQDDVTQARLPFRPVLKLRLCDKFLAWLHKATEQRRIPTTVFYQITWKLDRILGLLLHLQLQLLPLLQLLLS